MHRIEDCDNHTAFYRRNRAHVGSPFHRSSSVVLMKTKNKLYEKGSVLNLKYLETDSFK